MKLTTGQLGQLLHKSRNQPRRNQKRFLKDLGGSGSADELDEMLAVAAADPDAVIEANRLDREREITAKTIEAGVDARVAEMIAAIKVKMQTEGMTQEDMAESCGWNQSLVAKYLTGKAEPGSRNLAKMADALGCRWRLE
ncbi:MAG: helix-turn-helix transcriptional regulator [Planctomycetota bacterium]